MNSFLEKKILKIDKVLRMLFTEPQEGLRVNPAKSLGAQSDWSPELLQRSKGQMRINHTGEICAQALYQGHLSHGYNQSVKAWLLKAADEEHDHLVWCHYRLKELGTQGSFFNPIFYGCSYFIARVLSAYDEKMNLAFIRETEHQVQRHLADQLPLLKHDQRSCEIIEQMIIDEKKHHDDAVNFGAKLMPYGSEWFMRRAAALMKTVVFYL
jgi:ubiquinone biosynthesis monooxygenase Coq7